jgi:hypothetical protein
MTLSPPILRSGSCEPFKAVVHGVALGLAVVMGLYNAAAWMHRRERHLWINALIYGLACEFERQHVAHHLDACQKVGGVSVKPTTVRSNSAPNAAA